MTFAVKWYSLYSFYFFVNLHVRSEGEKYWKEVLKLVIPFFWSRITFFHMRACWFFSFSKSKELYQKALLNLLGIIYYTFLFKRFQFTLIWQNYDSYLHPCFNCEIWSVIGYYSLNGSNRRAVKKPVFEALKNRLSASHN